MFSSGNLMNSRLLQQLAARMPQGGAPGVMGAPDAAPQLFGMSNPRMAQRLEEMRNRIRGMAQPTPAVGAAQPLPGLLRFLQTMSPQVSEQMQAAMPQITGPQQPDMPMIQDMMYREGRDYMRDPNDPSKTIRLINGQLPPPPPVKTGPVSQQPMPPMMPQAPNTGLLGALNNPRIQQRLQAAMPQITGPQQPMMPQPPQAGMVNPDMNVSEFSRGGFAVRPRNGGC